MQCTKTATEFTSPKGNLLNWQFRPSNMKARYWRLCGCNSTCQQPHTVSQVLKYLVPWNRFKISSISPGEVLSLIIILLISRASRHKRICPFFLGIATIGLVYGDWLLSIMSVSYTHLDVYKRQAVYPVDWGSSKKRRTRKRK